MIHTLWPEEIEDKLWPLPVRELFMVGRATEKKLKKFGINTIGDLAKAQPEFLKGFLHSHGILVHQYANGIDNTEVTVNDEVMQKGLGNGLTYAYDLQTAEEIAKELLALCERVGARLRRKKCAAGIVTVHLRNSDLRGYSHQLKLPGHIGTTDEIFETAKALASEMWRGEPIRAMSVSVSEFCREDEVQLSMFDKTGREKNERLDHTIDNIRKIFGERSIFRGTFANSDISPIQGGVNDGNYLMMGGFKT